MPKRKRNSEPSFHDKLSKHLDEVFRALKAAKGFERQRLSKRQHEVGATAEKKERLEREISVLKVSLCPSAHLHKRRLETDIGSDRTWTSIRQPARTSTLAC